MHSELEDVRRDLSSMTQRIGQHFPLELLMLHGICISVSVTEVFCVHHDCSYTKKKKRETSHREEIP